MLKYPCLVLDHDDTVMKSTPGVNFPSVANVLKELMPGYEITLEQFALYNRENGDFYFKTVDALERFLFG